MRCIRGSFRRFSALLVCAAPLLCGTLALTNSSCTHQDTPTLTRPSTPVTLEYRFASDAVNKLELKLLLDEPGANGEVLHQQVAVDAEVRVMGILENKTYRLAVRTSQWEVGWSLPSTAEESHRAFSERMARDYEGTEFRISVTADGRIPDEDITLPRELDPAAGRVFNLLAQALPLAFLTLPDAPLVIDAPKTRQVQQNGEDQQLREQSSIELEGLDGANSSLVHITRHVDTVTTRKVGSLGFQERTRIENRFVFDQANGWVQLADATRVSMSPDGNRTLRLHGVWTPISAGQAGPLRSIQRGINDPCHPEYVGPRVCENPTGANGNASESTPVKQSTEASPSIATKAESEKVDTPSEAAQTPTTKTSPATASPHPSDTVSPVPTSTPAEESKTDTSGAPTPKTASPGLPK